MSEYLTRNITNQTEFHYKRKINSPSPKNKAIYGDKILDHYFYSFEIKALAILELEEDGDTGLCYMGSEYSFRLFRIISTES